MFMPTRKQDAKTAKNDRASGLPSCWARKNRWQKRLLLADENKSRATSARNRIGVSRRNNEQAATLFLRLSRGLSFPQKSAEFLPKYFRNMMNLWRRSLFGVTCRHFASHLLRIAVLCLLSTSSAPTRSPRKMVLPRNGSSCGGLFTL